MKSLKYVFLAIFTAIWIIGLSPDLTRKMTAQDGYRYGDLYRLSNLSKFKDPSKRCTEYQLPVTQTSRRKTHLYILGDSFTEQGRVGSKDFLANDYTYVHWSRVLHVKLDTGKTNILLIEVVERNFRGKFRDTAPTNIVPDSATFVDSTFHQSFMNKLDEAFESKSTKGRIEEVLFQNDFILKLKELKADFNLHFFDRVANEVTRVNGGQNIVYYQDTDTDTLQTTSSFSKINNAEIDSIVSHVNQTKKNMLKLGFDDVLLSIIPNKVSVLMPTYGKYNNLISRTYSHPDLDTDYIDVYKEFRNMGVHAYLKGDSHWTCDAQYLWLNKVNHEIERNKRNSDVSRNNQVSVYSKQNRVDQL